MPGRVAPMQSSASGAPFRRIAMDIVGPFARTDKGSAYILVIGDYFTKWVEAYPMKDMEAASVAVYLFEFICRYGAPDFLHTDQGKNFESTLKSDLCKLLGIVKTRTTPYHPQSDRMIERFNRTLLGMLSSGILEEERNWEQILPAVMMAYRTSVHKTTHMSPFKLVFGREVRLPVDVMFGNPPAELAKCSSMHALYLRNTLESAYHKVRKYLTVESRIQKEGYDRKVKGVNPAYKVGDLVWLHCPVVARGKSRKLHRPWKGPFVIRKIISDVVFRIQHRDPPRKCLVVHFNCLKPYLLCGRDAEEGTEQLSKQKDDEQDPSSRDKEVWEAASPDSDIEEDEVIVEEEHQDELEDHEAEGDEDEGPGEPPQPQAPLQAELGDGDREEMPGDPVVLRRSTRIRRPPDRLIWNI